MGRRIPTGTPSRGTLGTGGRRNSQSWDRQIGGTHEAVRPLAERVSDVAAACARTPRPTGHLRVAPAHGNRRSGRTRRCDPFCFAALKQAAVGPLRGLDNWVSMVDHWIVALL